jgi:hypothetical protein
LLGVDGVETLFVFVFVLTPAPLLLLIFAPLLLFVFAPLFVVVPDGVPPPLAAS